MEMTKNEIKKALYKEKPIAIRCGINKEGYRYRTMIDNKHPVSFWVPLSDMGDATFGDTMQAHLLIRYIDYNDKTRVR